jgi:hypothetical protein
VCVPGSSAAFRPLGFETVRLFLQGAIVSNLGEVRPLAPAGPVVVDAGVERHRAERSTSAVRRRR